MRWACSLGNNVLRLAPFWVLPAWTQECTILDKSWQENYQAWQVTCVGLDWQQAHWAHSPGATHISSGSSGAWRAPCLLLLHVLLHLSGVEQGHLAVESVCVYAWRNMLMHVGSSGAGMRALASLSFFMCCIVCILFCVCDTVTWSCLPILLPLLPPPPETQRMFIFHEERLHRWIRGGKLQHSLRILTCTLQSFRGKLVVEVYWIELWRKNR